MDKTSRQRLFSYGALIIMLAVVMVFGGAVPAQAQKGGPGNLGPLTPNAPPNYGSASLSTGFTPDPYTIDIGTGGTLNAAEANASCSGYVTAQPDFNLDWSGNPNAFLRIFTDATLVDTTLVVRTPAGQLLCNDDFGGSYQSAVDISGAAAGRYNIWVGTYAPGATGDAVLVITGQNIGPGALPTPTLRPDQLLDYNLEPNFGTTTLNAGFTPDPFQLAMTSGGTVNVAYLGDGCTGFATSAPDLRLQWGGNAPFLRIRIESEDDTTLIVNAPDGNWYCNDDTFGYNPAVDFQNGVAGQYDIWVGSYTSGTNSAATLFITEVAQNPAVTPGPGGGALDYNLQPLNGVLTLNSGFTPDPSTIQVAVGGTVDAASAGGNCMGMTTAAPTYRVAYTNGTSATFLRFYTESSDDTTMIVNAPDGNWYCVDDTFGVNPAVSFENPTSGQYDIWVASYGGSLTSATLGVTELRDVPGGMLDYNLEPLNGSLTLNSGFTPDPMTTQITAGGDVYAASADPTCRGLTTPAPTYRLFYTNATNASLLRFYAESSDDLTIAVNAPDGSWYCADDTFGSNPGVDFTSPASGQYDVWVGTYSGGQSVATLGITELVDVPGQAGTGPSALDYSLSPVNGSTSLNAGFTPDPVTLNVLAGGPADASTAGDGCTGMTTAAPTYRLQYNNAGAGSASFLRFYADSIGDTTLTINAPDGNWYCNDDTFNYNPAVDFQNPVSGQYDIWVGAFGGDSVQAMLGITEQPSVPETSTTTPVTGGTLDYNLTPNYGSTTLRAGFQPDPFSLSMLSGGVVDVSYLGSGCAGYASSAPDFSLNLEGTAQFLRFYVQSSEDTTLIVNTPDGAWQCSDDAFGTNPAVDLNNAAAGRYDIWVGSFGSNTNASAQLFITGLRTNQPR